MTRPLSSRPGRRRRSIPSTSFCCGRLTPEPLVPTVAAGVPLLEPSRCPTANEEPVAARIVTAATATLQADAQAGGGGP